MATADDIRGEDDLPREKVLTPEWKSCPAVWVRTVTTAERDQFDDGTLVKRGRNREANLVDLRVRLVILAACDEAGKPIFDETAKTWLGTKSSKVIDRIFGVAQRLCGMTAEDVENAVKN